MFRHIKHALPIKAPRLLLGVFFIAWLSGGLIDHRFDTSLDAFFHDSAIVKTPRNAWQHVAIVALDPGVPGFISRRQALPLYALAAQRVLEMGATAVFLDAVLYEYDHRTSYAICVEEFQSYPVPHQYRWQSSSTLTPFANLTPAQFQRLFIARPQFAGDDDFINITLLQSFFGEALLPVDFFELDNNTAQLQRLIADATVHKRSDGMFNTSFRWMNLSANAVVPKVLALHHAHLDKSTKNQHPPESCDGVPCQRIRFSTPKHNFIEQPELPVVPVSDLVSCTEEDDKVPQLQSLRESQVFENRVVILQLTDPSEATDIKVTPMISALGSPRQFLSGPQFLADAVETMVLGDGPARPPGWQRWILIGICAGMAVLFGAFVKTGYAFLAPVISLSLAWGLCFITAPAQLWPVVPAVFGSVMSILLLVAIHISMGTAKARLMAQYIPPQIRRLLLKYKGDKKFLHKHIDAVILMSDIAKYSNVTSELKDPAYVFQLLNYYFEETTLATQQKYSGWLESYVGDMVCFYWPAHEDTSLEEQRRLALAGAIDMANMQQQFFKELANDEYLDIPKDTLATISKFIDAGIGLTSGQVMMGNLGPENGIQKFGCLGDPLNLASRTESLTRHFNSEILITEDLADTAKNMGLRVRKVAQVVVKGRLTPVWLCALGEQSDDRFHEDYIREWEAWYSAIVSGENPPWQEKINMFILDKITIEGWLEEGLWDEQLRSFILQQK